MFPVPIRSLSPVFQNMISRRQREQHKNAGATSVEFFKRRRLENLDNQARRLQLHYNNNRPSETDTDNKARWFWNENANESQSDSKDKGDCGSESEESDKEEEEAKKKKTGNEEQLEKQEMGHKAATLKELQLE